MLDAAVQWRENGDGALVPYLPGRDDEVLWAPLPGSQQLFLSCPIQEVLYEGTRGPGKTDSCLMDFAQHVGEGWGPEWRGILFRRSYPELKDIELKARKLFVKAFPGARFNQQTHTWTFPGGEELVLSYMRTPDDYWRYHGAAFTWIGWEELTSWPSLECYHLMTSCLRSSVPGIPLKIRANANPYGVGHNVVRAYYDLPVPPGRVVGDIIREPKKPDRVAIHGDLAENIILLHAQPKYRDNLRRAARSKSQLRAWLRGDWDITAGGMFDDLWEASWHVLPPIPPKRIPDGWRVDRAYDHGSSKPFSVGWYAESNGEPITVQGRKIGTVPGDVIRFNEWYGWNGRPNEGLRMPSGEIARRILEREEAMGVESIVVPGPADSSIFDENEPGTSVAGRMQDAGVTWEAVSKGPGSRKQGWERIREMLAAAIPDEEGTREEPGLFVTSNCRQFLRCWNAAPRSRKDPDDLDTDSEDHIHDEVRYRCRHGSSGVSTSLDAFVH